MRAAEAALAPEALAAEHGRRVECLKAVLPDYTDASATWYREAAHYDVDDDAYEIVAGWNHEVNGYAREASACAADADTFGVIMY